MVVKDNVISLEESNALLNLLLGYSFFYGEVDRVGLPPTGMVHNFSSGDFTFQKLLGHVTDTFPELKEKTLYRAYVNYFAPCDRPYFHTDGEGITVLMYVTNEFNLDEGGETQFLNDDKTLTCVMPLPGRAVLFDGQMLHRATSYRTKPRLTVAFKYR